MIVFGWGRRTVHDAGPVAFQKCERCQNRSWFHLLTIRRWFTLFFIPIIPYETRHRMICPVCTAGVDLVGEGLARARRLNQIAVGYTTQQITGDEYNARYNEIVGRAVASDHDAPPAVAAPDQRSEQNATASAALPAAAPPPAMSLALQGSKPKPWVMVARAIAGVAMFVAVYALITMSHGSSSGGIQVGGCVSSTQNGLAIVASSCSGTHDARVDKVMSGSTDSCPPGDDQFVGVAPHPSLCLNYGDHQP